MRSLQRIDRQRAEWERSEVLRRSKAPPRRMKHGVRTVELPPDALARVAKRRPMWRA